MSIRRFNRFNRFDSDKIIVQPSGGLGSILFITFLVLKLTGVINWSWWWVTAPLWIPLAIVAGILGIAAIIFIIYAIWNSD